MKGYRYTAIFIVLLLTLPLVPFIFQEADGQRSMFSGAVLATPGSDPKGNPYNTNIQTPMDMEVDSQGRIYIVYQTTHTFTPSVFIVHSDDEGETWSEPSRVDDILRDNNPDNDMTEQIKPRMDIAANDTVYVVWEDKREFIDDTEPSSKPMKISMAWSEDGENFTKAIKVDPVKPNRRYHSHNPDITISTTGRMICTWEDLNISGSRRNIFKSYSDDGGVTWQDCELINTDDIFARHHYYPRMESDGDYVYITWHDNRNTDLGNMVFLSVSQDGGENFAAEKRVNDDIEEMSRREYAVPEVDDDGVLYITWYDFRSGLDEIFFATSSDHGMTISQNGKVSSAPDECSDRYPSIDTYGSGNLAVVWQRKAPTVDSYEYEIYYKISYDGGETWTDEDQIDHSDRYWIDIKDQEKPICCFDLKGRVLSCWMDENRETAGSTERDILFAHHSWTVQESNRDPGIMDPSFLGMDFEGGIGNAKTPFQFNITYRDWDNDPPAEGYPKLQIYSDPAGDDPIFQQPRVMERSWGPSDFYFMEGVEYGIETNISTEGKFYWDVEIKDNRGSGTVRSPILPGPRIDTTPPSLEILSPDGWEWMPTDTVTCRVRVTDTGGSHINEDSIQYLSTTKGIDNFVEQGLNVKGLDVIDNDTMEAWADIKLASGVRNYVKFQAKDRVGNGYTFSNTINLWLDPDKPYYTEVEPKARDTQLYEDVNCSILWRDSNPGNTNIQNVGLKPETIRYSYRTTSGDYSEWAEPDGLMRVSNDSYRSWVELKFIDGGVYNFIRWRASDKLNNTRITEPLRVNVDVPDNYPPVLRGKAYPEVVNTPTPHLFWEGAFDEEGDDLEYRVLLMDHPSKLWRFTSLRSVGDRTFYDVPENEELPPGHYVLHINVTDHIGGFDILEHVFEITETGSPPPIKVPAFGPYNLEDSNSTVSWEPSPSDAEQDLTYWVRIGTYEWGGDITEWIDVGDEASLDLSQWELPLGIYSLQVMAHREGNFSRVTMGFVKINDYDLDLDYPDYHIAYRGNRWTDAGSLQVEVVNLGTYSDNVTVTLTGELVDMGYAFLGDSGETSDIYEIPPSKGLSDWKWITVNVQIRPEASTDKGSYSLVVTFTSESGETGTETEEITVNITDAPEDTSGQGFGDDLYGFITDIFPFLDFIPKNLLVPLFILIVVLILVAIVALGIYLARRSTRSRSSEDPYAEQRKIYKELYGAEPTKEQLEAMKEGEKPVEDGENVIGGVDLSMISPGPETSSFDESFLDTESKPESEEE